MLHYLRLRNCEDHDKVHISFSTYPMKFGNFDYNSQILVDLSFQKTFGIKKLIK